MLFRISILVLCLVFILVERPLVLGQVQAVRAGSAEHAQRIYQAQRRQLESQQAFDNAKKITNLDLSKTPIVETTEYQCLDLDALSSGQVGRIIHRRFQVVQVVDDRNMIIGLPSGKSIWLASYSTSGFADDDYVFVLDYVKVLEPRSYTSVVGANRTIHSIELLSSTETERRLKEDAQTLEKWEESLKKAKVEKKAEATEWNTRDKRSVMGEFIEVKNSNLFIKLPNGAIFQIALAKLHPESRELAINLQKEKKAELTRSSKTVDTTAPKALPPEDSRNVWINLTYNRIYRKKNDTTWEELSMAGGIKFKDVILVSVTSEYIDLKDLKSGKIARLFSDRAEEPINGEWKVVGNGKWRTEEQHPAFTNFDGGSSLNDAFAFEDSLYGGEFKLIDRRWVKTDEKGQKILNFDEISITDSSVDLYCDSRQQVFKIRLNDVFQIENGKHSQIGRGKWKSPLGPPFRNSSSLTPQRGNDAVANPHGGNRASKELEVAVESTAVTRSLDARGQTTSVVKVVLKNIGTRPVRIVDGIYKLKGSDGTPIRDVPYTLLADSDSDTGILPGQTRVINGLIVPTSEGVTFATFVVSTVLEKASSLSRPPDFSQKKADDPLNDMGRIKDSLRYIATKKDSKNNGDIMHLYYLDGAIDVAKLEERCRLLKRVTDAEYFSCIVVFDDPSNAKFPSNPFSAGYGIDFEILKHIKAIYTFNKKNGYSDLELSGLGMQSRKP
jgi:hypothetical protein